MATQTKTYTGLVHAGAGTALFTVQLSAIIPGLLPTLALLALLAAVALLPILALGLAVAVVLGPPYALWRLARRRSPRRRQTAPAPAATARGEASPIRIRARRPAHAR